MSNIVGFRPEDAARIAAAVRAHETGLRGRGQAPRASGPRLLARPGVLTAWTELGITAATGTAPTVTYGTGLATIMEPNSAGTGTEAGETVSVKSEIDAAAPAGSVVFLTRRKRVYYLLGWVC